MQLNISDYTERIDTTIDFINANLTSDLQLKKLAAVAHFSPYHFHRIFRMVTGENVNEYVKRLRLEQAANHLIHNANLPVSEIAMESGYSSFSTFTRAFKGFYNENPSDYRKLHSKIGKIIRNAGTDFPSLLLYDHISDVHSQKQMRGSVFHMQVEVKVFPQYHVAYIRHLSYEKGVHNQALTDAFERVSSWVGANEYYTPEMKVMAVIHDHPDFTPLEKRRYDAAFTIREDIITGSGEISIQDIPSGKYAVAHVSINNLGPSSFGEAIAEVWRAFDYLHDSWLAGGGFLLDKRPCLEIYRTGPSDPILMIDVCIPVKAK